MMRSILRFILKTLYKVEVKGLENFRELGERAVITPNHTSFLDALLLVAFLPEPVCYAIYKPFLEKWWFHFVKYFIEFYGVEPGNPYAVKSLIKYVKTNKKIVIFPEGRITVTGALMKIYEGPGLIADKADAMVLPVLIQGAQYTPFSRLRGKIKIRLFPKITITCYKPEKIEINPGILGRKRREIVSQKLYDIMSAISFLGNSNHCTLFQSLLEAKKIHGGRRKIIEDIKRKPSTYNQLIFASFITGKLLADLSSPREIVGFLFPNASASVCVFFGLQAYKRVSALLNFSTGSQNVVLACQTAKIKMVATSRKFIEMAKLQDMIAALEKANIKIVYLEDEVKNITVFNKIAALLYLFFPDFFGFSSTGEEAQEEAKEAAVVLFTSGSEGSPKAVVLSSENIQTNKSQLASRIAFSSTDIVLNALPLFHAFGLTAGTVLPILYGLKVFFYPSPLHYRVIPEVAYDINATILFGTNTFLYGYGRYANPYDFYSLRYVYAGAEKLKEETRKLWIDKFGLRIFEGYGATETSPILSANTPMHYRVGSVGKLMPGIEYKLTSVPNIYEGGILSVKGPNIMLGYMFLENPGVLVPPPDGWYDTGDIVSVDSDGYFYIQGRVKRFAKIAGEMVSLAYVENYLSKIWPEHMHAMGFVPDDKKGDQLILVSTKENADKRTILQYVRENGISDLAVPKQIYYIDKMPLLGSGKIDHQAITKFIATQMLS